MADSGLFKIGSANPDSISSKLSPSNVSSSEFWDGCTLIRGGRFFAGFEVFGAAGARKIGSGVRGANPSVSGVAGSSIS